MKKFAALTMATLMLVSNAFASDISVKLDNEAVEFSSQQPVIVEGRTLIPLRGVFENLGYEISWDAETKTAVFKNNTTVVKVKVNSNELVVDEKSVPIDVAAQIINGSMMLPLRAVGEATGLEVEWDSDTKTVNLSSKSVETTTETTTEKATETTTEKATETTTEENKIRGVAESDMELLQMSARAYITLVSFEGLVPRFIYNDAYNMAIANSAMEYSVSDEKIEEALDQAILECENFKKAAQSIETGEIDKRVVKRFTNYIDAAIEDYEFLKNLHLTDMYDDLTDEQYEAKAQESVNSMKSEFTSFMVSLGMASEEAGKIASTSKYNAWDVDKMTSAEKSESIAYYQKIAKVANKSTNFLNNVTYATSHPEEYSNAANAIRTVLKNTETPDICVLDREIMLMACDLLDKAGENVRAAVGDDEISVEFITFDYSLFTFESVFDLILDEYYDTKYLEEREEEIDTEVEEEIKEKFV